MFRLCVSIASLIREDFQSHRRDILAQGFWALSLYRIGFARKSIAYSSVRKPWGVLHLLLKKWSEVFLGISIGINAYVGRRVIFEHFGGIIIHDNARIGNDVIIRQGVTIGNRHLDRPLLAPIIGDRVNIGAGAKLLGEIRVGDDVEIGANAVVITDVPSNSVAVGVPAVMRPRKRR